MLMPSIFGEDLFDNFMKDFPFFDDNAESNVEKKLYGRRGKNLMKTDIKETEGGYELEMDLPGFTKDEIKVSLENGYMTISAAKGLDKDEQDKKSGRYIRKERYNAGKSTVFEFNEAKTKYAQSLAEQAQAKYDFIFRTKILDFYNGNPIRL